MSNKYGNILCPFCNNGTASISDTDNGLSMTCSNDECGFSSKRSFEDATAKGAKNPRDFAWFMDGNDYKILEDAFYGVQDYDDLLPEDDHYEENLDNPNLVNFQS